MWIRKSKIESLSVDVKKLLAGEDVDIRDHQEGALHILRNDIHTLSAYKREQVEVLMQERDILKDTLADISHQLKTPLTSMMIMADLLENAPPAKQAEFIASIQSSLHRTEWLVSALLKMAKLEANSVAFKISPISSADLVKHAISSLSIQLELKGQAVQIVGQEEILCDKRWTSEALGNIIKNASEHSPHGAIIQVEVGKNPLSTWIKVTDQGDGLTRPQIAKIFKRFQGSENAQGFGIGLPLALTIMRSQFGDIDVDGGGKGTGASFTLKFYRRHGE